MKRLILVVVVWPVAAMLAPLASAQTISASPVSGSCQPSTIGCSAGTFADLAQSCMGNGFLDTWTCQGLNGGTNASCTEQLSAGCSAPLNAVCSGVAYQCAVGTPESTGTIYDSSASQYFNEYYTWYCAGTGGGANSPECRIPIVSSTTLTPAPSAPPSSSDSCLVSAEANIAQAAQLVQMVGQILATGKLPSSMYPSIENLIVAVQRVIQAYTDSCLTSAS